MNDTHVTVIGNALHHPETRRTANTGAVVTTFKIASTARRYAGGQWMDGNSLRVRVSCWRALADNVRDSVTRGDPLIVHGRLFTRDWSDEQGNKRTAYELVATAVGHDLSRGRAVFERVRAATSTSTIEDSETEQRIGGELTEPVSEEEATPFNDMPFEAALEEGLGHAPAPRRELAEPATVGEPDPDQDEAEDAGGEPVPDAPGPEREPAVARRRLRRRT